jgi:hypothetical protein
MDYQEAPTGGFLIMRDRYLLLEGFHLPEGEYSRRRSCPFS